MRANIKLNKICAEAEIQRLCVVARDDTQRAILRRRAANGEITHVHGPLYARSAYWDGLSHVEQYRHMIRTYAVLHPQWVFCDMSAAAMFGINDSRRHVQHLHILTTKNGRTHDYGVVRHHHIPRIEFVTVDGVRVTELGRTAFDCARRYQLPDSLPVIESALRQGLITRRQLHKDFTSRSGWHRDRAMIVIGYAHGKSENGGEAFVLGVMIDEGFEPPEQQVEISRPLGAGGVDRVDYAWYTAEGKLIVAELDGRVKYRDGAMYKNGSLPDTIIAEKEREERVLLVADVVVRFSFAEAMERTALVNKLEKAGVPRARGRQR